MYTYITRGVCLHQKSTINVAPRGVAAHTLGITLEIQNRFYFHSDQGSARWRSFCNRFHQVQRLQQRPGCLRPFLAHRHPMRSKSEHVPLRLAILLLAGGFLGTQRRGVGLEASRQRHSQNGNGTERRMGNWQLYYEKVRRTLQMLPQHNVSFYWNQI